MRITICVELCIGRDQSEKKNTFDHLTSSYVLCKNYDKLLFPLVICLAMCSVWKTRCIYNVHSCSTTQTSIVLPFSGMVHDSQGAVS